MRKPQLAKFPECHRLRPQILHGLPKPQARWQIIYVFETLSTPLARRQILALDAMSQDLSALGIASCAVSSEPEKSMRIHAQVLGLELPLGCDLSDETRLRYGLACNANCGGGGAQVLLFDPNGKHHVPDFTDVSSNDLEVAVLAFALRDIPHQLDNSQPRHPAIPM
jgi:peroxiredoxin